MPKRPDAPKVLVNLLLEPSNVVSGITRYAFFLLRPLIARGHVRIVLATTWSPEMLPDFLRGPDVEVRQFPHIKSQPLNVLRQLRLLPRLMREMGADLEFNPNPIGNFLGRWPRVVTVHDLYMKTMPGVYPARHRLWWNLFFPAIVQKAAHFVCVSENTRKDLTGFYPAAAAKSSTVLSASGLTARHPPQQDRSPFFGLFVCNTAPNKGTDTLVEAMDILARRGHPVDIRHVGKDIINAIPSAQARLGTTAAPRHLGFISDEDLTGLYETASFLVFPSRLEGFGLPVIEAQTFGVPAIASDIPVLREVAGEGAVFFPPGDAQALAARIEALRRDHAHWLVLSRAAIDNAARYSWDSAAAEVEDIFLRALGCNHRVAPAAELAISH